MDLPIPQKIPSLKQKYTIPKRKTFVFLLYHLFRVYILNFEGVTVILKFFQSNLVGGFNPFEKYARQIGSLPQVGMRIQKYFKPPPRNFLLMNLWLLLIRPPQKVLTPSDGSTLKQGIVGFNEVVSWWPQFVCWKQLGYPPELVSPPSPMKGYSFQTLKNIKKRLQMMG